MRLKRDRPAQHDPTVKTLAPAIQAQWRGAAARRSSRAGGPRRRRRRASDRHRRARGRPLPGLKPDHIAGCGGLAARATMSMRAGELGADYVLFGEPDAGRRPSLGGRPRPPGLVGRAVRAALRRLRGGPRRGADLSQPAPISCGRRARLARHPRAAACAGERSGAGAMMRRLLLCGAALAALMAAHGAYAQAPMQITPPAARPLRALRRTSQDRGAIAQKLATTPALKPPSAETKGGEGGTGSRHTRPPAPPSAFAPEKTPAVPFTRSRNCPPRAHSRPRCSRSRPRARRGRRVRRVSARLLPRSLQGSLASRQRTGRPVSR